ncbi:MAG: CCC motif membrane protein [Chitinophagaceae bacterium]|jgi:hypothetical protein
MDNQSPEQNQNFLSQESLPNATAVLVLGIISIVACCFYGLPGLICGIIALVLAKKDTLLYKENPGRYSSNSFGNLKAGKVCAIIGVSLASIFVIYIIVVLAFVGIHGLSNMDDILKNYK